MYVVWIICYTYAKYYNASYSASRGPVQVHRTRCEDTVNIGKKNYNKEKENIRFHLGKPLNGQITSDTLPSHAELLHKTIV